jgi:hypothetical protein
MELKAKFLNQIKNVNLSEAGFIMVSSDKMTASFDHH